MVYYLKLGTLTPSPGIYIQDTEGFCLTYDEWERRTDITPANGIAVVLENHSFVIQISTLSYWSNRPLSYNESESIYPDLPKLNLSDAVLDFEGYTNTQKINNAYSENEAAAHKMALAYTFPNGKKGYLGSAGEWNSIVSNIDEIEGIISLLGGKSLKEAYFWTSTGAPNSNNNLCFWAYSFYSHKNGFEQQSVDTSVGILVFTTL